MSEVQYNGRMPMYRLVANSENDTLHYTLLRDKRVHNLSFYCPCGPYIHDTDLVVHNPFHPAFRAQSHKELQAIAVDVERIITEGQQYGENISATR